MIRDITMGQYYKADSSMHKLDPRVKIIGTMLYIILLFSFRSIAAYLAATIFLAVMIWISKVPLKFIVKGFKSIIVLVLVTVMFQLFLTPGEEIFHIWRLKITYEGVKTAAYMGIRMMYLIVGSSLMTLTTTPNQLTDALESLLKPLKHIKVPVHEIAMMMSIALRFIPILVEETDKIMKAQSARGADFESGTIVRRAKGMVPILVPLFISAFRRANDLAMAMEARCYRGGEGRTKMKPLVYRKDDFIAFGILSLYVGIQLVVRTVLE